MPRGHWARARTKTSFFIWGDKLGLRFGSIRIYMPNYFTFSFKLSSVVLRSELQLILLFLMILLPPTNIHPSTVSTASGSPGSPSWKS